MLGRRGIFKKEKKYTKLVDALYPAELDAPINSHQLGNLTHYANITPNKLQKIGKYIEKRTREDLKKGRLNFVEISLLIFNELISKCTENLAFFSEALFDILLLLLNERNVSLKCAAVDTFVVLAQSTQKLAHIQQLDSFINSFIQMTTTTSAQEDEQKRFRVHGLRGIKAYVRTIDDFDSAISKYIPNSSSSSSSSSSASSSSSSSAANDSFGAFLPAILSSIRTGTGLSELDIEHLEAPADWKETSIHVEGILCLRDLADRLNNITLRPIFELFLRYLDANNLWDQTDFTVCCLRTFTVGLKPQHRHLVQVGVLQHIGSPSLTPALKTSIVELLKTTLQNNTGPVIEPLSSLLRHLLHSSQSASDEEQNLQRAIIECIAIITERVDPFQRLDAMSYILQRFEDHQIENSEETDESAKKSPQVSNRMLCALLRSILAIAQQLEPLPDGKSYSNGFLTQLADGLKSPDCTVRQLIHQIYHQLMARGGWLETVREHLSSVGSLRASVVLGPTFSSLEGLSHFRAGIWNSALFANNEPLNYELISANAHGLIAELGIDEIQESLPIILTAQDATSEPPLDGHHNQALHALIANVLLFLARRFEVTPLIEHINHVLDARREAGELSPVFADEGGLLKASQASFPAGEAKQVTNKFAKKEIIGLLVDSPALALHQSIRGQLELSSTSEGLSTSAKSSETEQLRILSRSGLNGAHRSRGDTPTHSKSESSTAAIARTRWTAQNFKQIFETPYAATTLPEMPALSFADAAAMSSRAHRANHEFLQSWGNTALLDTNINEFSPQSIINIHYPQYAFAV